MFVASMRALFEGHDTPADQQCHVTDGDQANKHSQEISNHWSMAKWEGVTEVTTKGLLIGGKTQLSIIAGGITQLRQLQADFYSGLPDYFSQDELESRQKLKAVICDRMRKAAMESRTTLAIPAMADGRPLGYPGLKTAQWIVEEIVEYLTLFPGCSLKQVNIVISGVKLEQSYRHFMASLQPPPNTKYTEVSANHVLINCHVNYDIVFVSLADAEEEVIINSTGPTMDMTVSVAKALADIAGPELAGACASFGWLHYGSLVVTEGYKLPCNFIVHCNAYFKKDDQDCKKLLRLIKKCLACASTKKAKSVALPAIGLGVKGFPHHEIARTTLQAVTEFSQETPLTPIRHVKLYIYKPKTETRQGFDCLLHMPSIKIPDKLKFVHGDLSKTKADVIINSTTLEMSLKERKVSSALLQVAGYALQAECTDKAPLNIGDVVVTDSYGLNCKKVFNVSPPLWDQGANEKKLQDIIHSCLTKMEELEHKTIAFSALGTGRLGFPADIVAACFIKAVEQYSKKNPNTKVESVLVLTYGVEHTQKVFEKYSGQLLDKLETEVSQRKPVVPASLKQGDTKMEIDLPIWWERPVNSYTEPEVGKGSDEWRGVEREFLRTLDRQKARITEERSYEAKRKTVARKLAKSDDQVETCPLWHGTTSENTKKITCSKFYVALAGEQNGARLGKGSYFAADAFYSSHDFFSKPDENGDRYMIQCRVITGEYCVGKQSMKSAPYKPGSTLEQFDTVVDDINKPRIYCAFHDNSAYPEYIIKYRY